MPKANYFKAVLLIVLLAGIVGIVGNLAGAQPFRFTASADNRPVESENIPRWEWVLDEITRLVGDESVFHIMPGDFDDPEITNASLKEQFGGDVVWYPVVGNHETETPEDMTWIRSHAPPIDNPGPAGCETTTYSWDYGNAHFVALNEYYDGTSDTGTDGDVVDALYDWLAADLAANTQPVVFVFGHEPAYPEYRHVGDSLDGHKTNRDRFWKLLNDEKVIAYICGHTHYYYAKQVGGPNWEAFTWQVDCGNSGNTPEDNQTFVDVTVTEADVIFQVFQGTKDTAFRIVDFWIVDIPAPIE
ncbi:MAG: metallophosphoesterase family protein [Planctomycetota bacterium]